MTMSMRRILVLFVHLFFIWNGALGFSTVESRLILSRCSSIGPIEQSIPSTSMSAPLHKPDKVLPPLVRNILPHLPPPISGFSLTATLTKVRGGRGINALSKHIAQLGTIALAFYSTLLLHTSCFWPIYVRLMQKFGRATALFVVSNLLTLSAVPLIVLLTIPYVTSTLLEFKPIAQKNIDNMKSMLFSRMFQATLLTGTVLPTALIWAFCPVTTSIPSMRPGAYTRQLAVFVVCLEMSYYLVHRAMHQARSKNLFFRWLARIHKVHHSTDHSNMMLPIDALQLHPVEIASTILAILLGPILCQSHPFMAISWSAYVTQTAFIVHTEFYDIDEGAHTMHHQRRTCNYGLFNLAGRIFKTSCSQ